MRSIGRTTSSPAALSSDQAGRLSTARRHRPGWFTAGSAASTTGLVAQPSGPHHGRLVTEQGIFRLRNRMCASRCRPNSSPPVVLVSRSPIIPERRARAVSFPAPRLGFLRPPTPHSVNPGDEARAAGQTPQGFLTPARSCRPVQSNSWPIELTSHPVRTVACCLPLHAHRRG